MAYPEAINHYPKSFQILIIKLHNRVEAGKNVLCGVFGETGGGKSTSVIQIMKALYLYKYGKPPTDEYLLQHTFFKAKPFLEDMRKLAQHLQKTGKKKKQAWLFDEAGVEASSRNWQSLQNKIIGWLAQTFRNLQQIIFFTTPSLSFLDSNVRKLLHYYLEAVDIDKKRKICILKPLQMQYNTRLDKIYYHNLTYPTQKGLIEVEVMGCPKISDELEEKYEKAKAQFQDTAYGEMVESLNKLEDKNKPKLTERQEKILALLENKTTSTSEIAKKIGVPASTISVNLGYMRKKGVNIDKYRVKNDFKAVQGKPTEPST